MKSHSAFLLRLLSKEDHEIGAEIGVFEGDNSLALLDGLPGLKVLLCVDSWKHYPDFAASTPNKKGKVANANFEEVEKVFLSQMEKHKGRFTLIKDDSNDATMFITNGCLDFVFIDGNHAYAYVKKDIEAWSPKVKSGGLIIGHDYVNKPGYGVIEAVNEAFDVVAVDRRSKCWYTVKE